MAREAEGAREGGANQMSVKTENGMHGHFPTVKQFVKCLEKYEEDAERTGKEPDPVYTTTMKWLRDHWGNPEEMADGIYVFLRIWNQAFYRVGTFNIEKLDDWLRDRLPQLTELRKRKIQSLNDDEDDEVIHLLYKTLLPVLAVSDGKKKGLQSQVSVAKALHALLPDLLPPWDTSIAKKYGCNYRNSKHPEEEYLKICYKMKEFSAVVSQWSEVKKRMSPNRSLLKIIDEYNYAWAH